jgi:hypothetical protein
MKAFRAIAVAALLPLSSVDAATVAFSAVSGPGPAKPNVTFGRLPTAAQISRGVPADARIHEFLVTTDADIQEIDQVQIMLVPPAILYQIPDALGGNDIEPPRPQLEALLPELGSDSWITTPGLTHTGDNGGPFPVNWQWFDVTNDGPVTDFMFARITVTSPDTSELRGG